MGKAQSDACENKSIPFPDLAGVTRKMSRITTGITRLKSTGPLRER